MSKQKNKKFTHGGARPGSGPKPNKDGPKTTKICVSVNKENWQTALSRWQNNNRSRLVDWLVSRYVSDAAVDLEMGAA